jgi:mono/diheme cytochrome c family protein
MKSVLLVAMAAALVLPRGLADQGKATLVIPASKTDPTDGRAMYTSYCAPCHGADARGGGPVAPALNAKPTDLTGLAKANHGKYPDSHIVSVLRFGAKNPAHGSAGMPVWGNVFARMNKVNSNERDLRMANLARYLESLQAR